MPLKKEGLIWYTERSKLNEGTGSGVCGHGTRQTFSSSPEQYLTLFEADVYTIYGEQQGTLFLTTKETKKF
jgi:hypothetical protein